MTRRAKGEGTLYQTPDKKHWIYQYSVDGQRKTKRFRRKADAQAFMKALAAAPVTPETATEAVVSKEATTEQAASTPAEETRQENTPVEAEEAQQEENAPVENPSPKRRRQKKERTAAPRQKATAPPMTQIPMQMQGISEILTVGEWMDRWLETYAKPTVKLSTYCSYELYIRGHIKPQIGGLYMSSLRVDDLQAFFNDRKTNGNLKGEGGLAPKTLANMRNMLHLAFEQARKNRLLFENVVEGVRIPRIAKNEMRVLNREEQDRLTTAARLAPEPAAFGIIFDMFTGLRLGELCGLRWANVDMEGKAFLVCETRNRLPNHDDSIEASTSVKTIETTKTENSRRTVYLTDNLSQDLAKYKTIQDSIAAQYPGYNPDGYVFCQENGRPYEPRTYQDLFKRCVRQAGIRDANFHALRHTFATRSLEQGMDIVTLSRLLGHANPSVTMDKYGHALEDHKRVSIQKLDGLYSGASAKFNHNW